jgi:hypothetical protein
MDKVIGFLVVAFLFYFVISQPVGAADAVQSVGSGFASAADSLATFVNAVTPDRPHQGSEGSVG